MVRRDALLYEFAVATEDVPAHRRDARSLTQSLEVERHSFDRGSACRVVRVDVRLEVIEYGLRVGHVERIPVANREEGHLAERHNAGGVTVEIPTTVLVEHIFSSPCHSADSGRIPRCRQTPDGVAPRGTRRTGERFDSPPQVCTPEARGRSLARHPGGIAPLFR